MAENGSSDLALGYMMAADGNSGGNNGWGGFGDGIWALAVLALLFGRGGFGGFGGGGCDGGCATQADVRAAVDQQTLISKIDQQTYGLADTFNSLNNTLNNNFRGIDNALCTLGYQTQTGFNGISRQLADCCCTIERQIERGFCDTNANIAAQTRSIIDYLTNEKIDSLRAENQTLKFAASQANQNQYLIDQLRPCPVPAFITCNPYASVYGTGYNNNCGCGCG